MVVSSKKPITKFESKKFSNTSLERFKMSKGTYEVNENGPQAAPSSRDVSYKSCLCALLIFIAICLIILLVGIKWSRDSGTKEKFKKEEPDHVGSQDEYKGKGQTSSTSRRPAVTFPRETTTTSSTTQRSELPIIEDATTSATTKRPTTILTTTETSSTASTSRTTESPTTISTTAESSSTTSTSTTTKRPAIISITAETSSTPSTSTTTKSSTTILTTESTVATATSTTPVVISMIPWNTDRFTEIPLGRITTTNGAETTESIYDYDENFNVISKTTEGTEEKLLEKQNVTTEAVSSIMTTKPTSTTPTTISNVIFKNNVSFTTPITTEFTEELFNETAADENETALSTLYDVANINNMSNTTEITISTSTVTTSSVTDPLIDIRFMKNITTIPTVLTTAKSSSTTEFKPEITDDVYEQDLYDETETDVFIATTPASTQTNENATLSSIQTTTEKLDNKRQILLIKANTTTSPSPPLNKTQYPPVCSTAACKSEASHILSLMDHSADPCEDFYEFACGGMQVDNDDSDTWRRITEQLYLIDKYSPRYLQTFRNFYDSCVSHEYVFDYKKRIERVLELVKDIGQIYDDEPIDPVDITELFAKLIIRRSLPVMDIDIDITKEHISSSFILKLTSPKPTSVLKESGRWSALTEAQMRCLDEQRNELQKQNLNLTEIYESYLACQKNHSIYLNSIQTVVRALGFYSHVNNTFNETQLMQDLRTTIEWDVLEHLNSLPSPGDMRKEYLFRNFTVYRITDLQLNYPYLEWSRLFNILTGHQLDNNTRIQVYFPSYLSALFEGLAAAPKWKIHNALVAMYTHHIYENLVIPQAKHKREDYCIKLSSFLFNDISSNLYLKTWSTSEIEDSQKLLKTVFSLLKKKLKLDLQQQEWLDDDSKIQLLPKLDNLALTFNKLEDPYNSDLYLDAKYSDVAMDPGDFQNNVIIMFQKHSRKRYNLQGQSCSSKDLWSYFRNAFDTSPTSFYSENVILAPLGMVKQPVKESLAYITMARIGLSLAREIGRHFDPVGIHYRMTLSPTSKPSYDTLVHVMESDLLFSGDEHIGKQKVTFNADTKLSVNERITDNTAMKLVSENFELLNGTELLLPWMSTAYDKEKVFFITLTQEYCKKTEVPEYMQQLFETEILPASLRVKNIMSNSERFSELFACPDGSAMTNNPFKKQFPDLPKEEDYNYNYNYQNQG